MAMLKRDFLLAQINKFSETIANAIFALGKQNIALAENHRTTKF